jgi:hypothetical protein
MPTTPDIGTLDAYADFYLAQVRQTFRSWQIQLLPGYKYKGGRQHAFCRWKRRARYWLFHLDYGQLDTHCPRDALFAVALERIGPDLTSDLWLKHRESLSREACFFHGGWKWWSGRGLSEALVLDLRDLLVQRYVQAVALYESWQLEPIRWDSEPPPEDPVAREKRLEEQKLCEQRQRTQQPSRKSAEGDS